VVAASPANFMSSIIRARNGVIVCSFVRDGGTIPQPCKRYLLQANPMMPQIPYGAAVPFNERV
jgi:hypothetical protein